MKRMSSVEELVNSTGLLMELVHFGFKKGLIVCHPLVPLVFLPEGLKYIPKEAIEKVKVRYTFLYSKDGKKWEANPDELVREVSKGGTYYIADLNLDTFFKVEVDMLEALVDLFNRELPIVYSESMYWRSEFLGEVTLIKFEEYMEAIAL